MSTEEQAAAISSDLDVISKRIDALIAERNALRLDHDELAHCLKEMLNGFEQGVFVRNIEGDGQSDWAVKLIPFVALLGRSQAAVRAAEKALKQ